MADQILPRFARPGDRAEVRLPDGRVRRAVATAIPDTFFSTPARVSIDGRSVRGWVGISDDGSTYEFHPES